MLAIIVFLLFSSLSNGEYNKIREGPSIYFKKLHTLLSKDIIDNINANITILVDEYPNLDSLTFTSLPCKKFDYLYGRNNIVINREQSCMNNNKFEDDFLDMFFIYFDFRVSEKIHWCISGSGGSEQTGSRYSSTTYCSKFSYIREDEYTKYTLFDSNDIVSDKLKTFRWIINNKDKASQLYVLNHYFYMKIKVIITDLTTLWKNDLLNKEFLNLFKNYLEII